MDKHYFKISANFREDGQWHVDKEYEHLDVAPSDGSSYLYMPKTRGNAPLSNRLIWFPLAKRGARGFGGVAVATATAPIIDGPSTLLNGATASFTASSNGIGTATVLSFEWDVNGVTMVGETIELTHNGVDLGTMVVYCRAITATGTSDWTGKTIEISSTVTPPDVTNMTISLADPVLMNGSPVVVGFYGATTTDGSNIYYRVSNPVGCTFSKVAGISATTTLTPTGASTLSFDVQAVSVSGAYSAPVTVTRIVATAPDVSGVTNSLGSFLDAGSTEAFTLANFPAGMTITAENASNCVVTVVDSVTGECTIDVADAASATFTLRFTAVSGLSSLKVFTYPINHGPSVSQFAHSVPSVILADASVAVSFTGITDPEGDAVTLSIVDAVNCSFAKTSGVVVAEVLSMTVTTANTYSFAVIATDSNGKQSVALPISGIINHAPAATAVTSTFPGILTSTTPVVFTLTGGIDVDGNAIQYSITNVVGGSMSKVSGINGGENVTFTPSGVAVSFDVTVVDSHGVSSVTVKTISASYNQPPVSTNVLALYPSTMVRGTVNNVQLVNAFDADGDATTYVITAVNGCTASVAETTGAFTIDVAGDASTVWVEAKVRDARGLESTVKRFTFTGTLTYATGTITIPAGTTQTVTIPEGIAGTVTVSGNGGAGSGAAPGASSTLTGDISKTFSGALSGVVAVPSSTQEPFTLSPATAHSITATAAANGGSITIAW